MFLFTSVLRHTSNLVLNDLGSRVHHIARIPRILSDGYMLLSCRCLCSLIAKYFTRLTFLQVEVDEDPAEASKDEQDGKTEVLYSHLISYYVLLYHPFPFQNGEDFTMFVI